ncbi:MAG: FeoA family protein [Anaerovoracaceae bacterium]
MAKGLLTLKKGDMGNVKLINAGKTATRRLYEMGFNTGAPVRVIKNDSGPVIVSLAGNKVALGRGLAEKIELDIRVPHGKAV